MAKFVPEIEQLSEVLESLELAFNLVLFLGNIHYIAMIMANIMGTDLQTNLQISCFWA